MNVKQVSLFLTPPPAQCWHCYHAPHYVTGLIGPLKGDGTTLSGAPLRSFGNWSGKVSQQHGHLPAAAGAHVFSEWVVWVGYIVLTASATAGSCHSGQGQSQVFSDEQNCEGNWLEGILFVV